MASDLTFEEISEDQYEAILAGASSGKNIYKPILAPLAEKSAAGEKVLQKVELPKNADDKKRTAVRTGLTNNIKNHFAESGLSVITSQGEMYVTNLLRNADGS